MKLYVNKAHRDVVYSVLIDAIDCGPFDGGCLAFARALQTLHGGEVHVIEGGLPGHPVFAQHAILRTPDGRWLDGDGVGTEGGVTRRFVTNEHLDHLTRVAVRPWREGDLPEAPSPQDLVERLAEALRSPPQPQRRAHSRP